MRIVGLLALDIACSTQPELKARIGAWVKEQKAKSRMEE
jgi:hypothetical protein